MRPWLAAVVAALLAVPFGARAEATPRASPAGTAAPAVPFAPGEQIDVVVDYHHVHTGKARIMVGRPEGAVWPVIFQARTDGLATLLDIREHYVSYWDADAHQSRGSDLNAFEVGDRHTDRARFDRVNGVATVEVLRKGRNIAQTRPVPPDVRDLASALLDVRMRPMVPGTRFEFPVFSGGDSFTLRGEVEGDETIDVPAGRFETTRVKVQLGFTGRFETKRDAHVWISRDARRIPVRLSADFAVGNVVVSLAGYRAGGEMAAAR